MSYKQVVSIYPTLNGRIRAESNGHQLNHLLGGTRWTHYPIAGYYEGNFNMRAIEKIKSKAEFYKDYWTLNIDPRLEHVFQEWKIWRDQLLLIKNQASNPLLKLKYWKYDALRDYQAVDIQFLHDGGSIDALEMGLGKTVECCAVLDMWMLEYPEMQKILVVCPSNAIHTWKNHIIEWTQLTRNDIMIADQNTQEDRIVPIVLGQHPDTGRMVTIVNWETLRLEICGKYLTEFEYDAIICDEVHRVRNPRAKQSKAFRKLRAKTNPNNRFQDFKLECSGTTVVNYGTDLFPLVNWLHPDQYDDEDIFREDFVEKPATDIIRVTKDGLKREAVNAVTQELDYIMIERRKKEVLAELPEKIKEEILLPLNRSQRTKYNQMRDELITILETEDENRSEFVEANVALAQIMRLKQLAVSPATIELAQRSFRTFKDVQQLDTMKVYNDDSSKLDWIMDFLDDLEDGKKVVIFSEFKSSLALLEKRLLDKRYPYDYCVLTGDTKRIVYQQYDTVEELETQFQNDPKIRIWMGTLKASGEALTLTAASDAIMMDFWWNAATMDQAEDRIYRFGQTKAVTIYDLVAEDTIEKDIREVIVSKRNLANTMLRSKKFLLELLKKDKERV